MEGMGSILIATGKVWKVGKGRKVIIF